MTAGGAVPASGFTASVGRLLGADPNVFVPFVRAYGLIVRRRSRMKFSRGISAKAMGRVTPFHMACVMSALFGIAVVLALGTAKPPLLGAVAAMTLGLLIVVFAVLFDYLEVLMSPDEYRVIAAHPHDAWSVVSAKIFVVGRAIATLSLCFFTPSIVAIGFIRHSALASAGFALGAALGTFSATLGAMLVGVGILARWGRVALLRFLPAIQGIFLIAYFSISMGRRWLIAGGHSLGTELSPWFTILPSTWFLAPLEWVTGVGTPATWLRGALAFGTVIGLMSVGARWQRSGFGETLLAVGEGAIPVSKRRRRQRERSAAGAGSKARTPWIRDPAVRAFFSLARIHARADLAFRSQMIVSVLMPMMIFISPSVSVGSRRVAFPELTLLFAAGAVGFAIMSLTTSSATSARPEGFWPVLISPISRERYSLAVRGLLRWGLVLPVAVAAGAWYLATAVAVPWHERIARVLGVAVYLELLATLMRGIAPEPPFTVRPSRDRRLQWSQVAAMMIGFAISGFGGFGLYLVWLFRGWGAWAGLVALSAVRVPVEFWTRWRVRRAWDSLDTA